MRTATPIRDAAEQSLRRFCDEALKSGITRLPPVTQLARRCGVSVPTMWKALQRLKEQGVLAARPRAGIFILQTPHARPPVASRTHPPPSRTRWETVAEAVAHDILCGAVVPGGVLPGAKELARRHGTTPRTVRRALASLGADRQVVQDGRGYRVPLLQGRTRAEIILIARSDEKGDFAIITPRTIPHLRALENACSLARVTLTPVTWGFDEELRYTKTRELFDPGRHNRGILGCILWTLTLSETLIHRFTRLLAEHGAPVALFDENGETRGCTLPQRPWGVRVFMMADTTRAGQHVASLLVSNGHTRALFLGPVSQSDMTVQSRLAGLQQGFALAGLPDAVRVIDSSGLPWSPTAIREHRHLDLRLKWLAQEASVPDERVRSTARRLSRSIDVDRMDDANAIACWGMLRHLIEDGYQAVVAASDDLALSVVRMAQLRNVRVPAGLSVVGFDNIPDAAMENLTSCDLNGSAYMQAMLSWILNPRQPGLVPGRDPVVIDANLIVRGSVGRRNDSTTRDG